jgi:hypothetical protein
VKPVILALAFFSIPPSALAFGPRGCEDFERQCVCVNAHTGSKSYYNSCKSGRIAPTADYYAWQDEQDGKCVKGSVSCYDLPTAK